MLYARLLAGLYLLDTKPVSQDIVVNQGIALGTAVLIVVEY